MKNRDCIQILRNSLLMTRNPLIRKYLEDTIFKVYFNMSDSAFEKLTEDEIKKIKSDLPRIN